MMSFLDKQEDNMIHIRLPLGADENGGQKRKEEYMAGRKDDG